eukprot:g804.t1
MMDMVAVGTEDLLRALGIQILAVAVAVAGTVYSVFSLTYAIFATFAVIALSSFLIRMQLWKEISKYVKDSLNSDLLNIEEHYLKHSETHYFVATLDSVVVGCVALDRAKREPENDVNREMKQSFAEKHTRAAGTWGELRRMSVCRSARKLGVARALHARLVDFARSNDLTGIFLSTSSMQGPAIRFYESLGYRLYLNLKMDALDDLKRAEENDSSSPVCVVTRHVWKTEELAKKYTEMQYLTQHFVPELNDLHVGKTYSERGYALVTSMIWKSRKAYENHAGSKFRTMELKMVRGGLYETEDVTIYENYAESYPKESLQGIRSMIVANQKLPDVEKIVGHESSKVAGCKGHNTSNQYVSMFVFVAVLLAMMSASLWRV